MTLCHVSTVLQCILYIKFSSVYKNTWTGFSAECLKDWSPFLNLALPGSAMLCLEWWGYEILTILSGMLGELDLAAQSITLNAANVVFMIPLGLSTGVSVRVGNHLGACKPGEAKTASRIAAFVALFCGVVTFVVIYSLQSKIPLIYSEDSDVITLTTQLMKQMSIFVLFDGIQSVLAGVIRGTGRQKVGAKVILVGVYFFAFPVGIPLMMKTYLRVSGAWWGMTVAVVFESAVFIVFIVRLNWKKEAEKAQERTGVRDKINTPESEDSLPEAFSDEAAALQEIQDDFSDSGKFKAAPVAKEEHDIGREPHRSGLRNVLIQRFLLLGSLTGMFLAGVVAKIFIPYTDV